jgi:5-methylthioadenosine/S-adenosylhomocysteine deaminase
MLLTAKYVFPISGEPIIGGAIYVKGSNIADIGDAEALKLRYPDEEIKDFGVSVLMPGFVDLNTQIEETALRGVVTDKPFAEWVMSVLDYAGSLELSDWYDSAVLGGLDALSAGITTIAGIAQTEASLKAANKLGLRSVIYRSVGVMDKSRINYAINSAARDIYKWRDMSDQDRTTIGIAPAAIYSNHPEVFARVSKLAISEDLPVAMKLAASREEYNFVRYGSSMFAVDNMPSSKRGYVEIPPWLPFGVSPVRYALNWGAFDAPQVMLVHAVYVDDEDIKKLREHSVSICTCPRANAQLGMGIAPLNDFMQAGLKVGLGTESPAATESTDMLAEMRTGLLLQRASNTRHFFSASKILELATIGGARALGLDDKIGTLDIGKHADIVAIDLTSAHQSSDSDPISAVVYTCSPSDVLMTMVDGEILYEKNHFSVDIEVAKNIARVIEIRSKLKSQL